MRTAAVILAGTISSLSLYPPVSGRAVRQRAASEGRADAVREAFRFAWDGYMKYAYPNDELRPVTNTSSNSRNGWGASSVDALSTACVMRLPDVVDEVLNHVSTIDFSKTSDLVNLFETTIRYLGGLLSGYNLLSGPLPELSDDKVRVFGLLEQAQTLADRLAPAFDTPTGIPFNDLNITNGDQVGDGTNSIATIGTLVLEWTRLGDFLGNPAYGELAQRGESYLLNPKPPSGEPFPGLIGTIVDIDTGEILVSSGGWGGGDDSFYEYLIKMYVYDRRRFAHYRDRWVLAADSTISYLKSHPSSRRDLTFVAGFNGRTPVKSSSHLACFAGGNFILGGMVLNESKYVDFGLEIVNGCHQTYVSTATRIGPELFSWDERTVRDRNDQAFFDANGFTITNGAYILRPEVIESYYYAYRATGDSQYQDWAWDAFVAINATTRTWSGFAGIWDVNAPGGGDKIDMQESFLFAEVFKYAYLIFAEEEEWQVAKNGTNAWVFNTEGHPMEVVGRLRR